VVVQEIFGLDQYVLADVARWSALGFEVLAPSIFDRAAPGYVAEHEPAAFPIGIGHVQSIGLEKMLSDIQACIDDLAPRVRCSRSATAWAARWSGWRPAS
jgi:carboxymethylenebutenolidase